MQTSQIDRFARDRSRRPMAKARSQSRRAARKGKSARLFLAFAFPAELDTFGARAPIEATEAKSAFVCDPAQLADAVKFIASRIVERRNSAPILSHIRISADIAGTVTLRATDTDLQATIRLAARVEAPGDFCTEAHALADLADKFETMATRVARAEAAARRAA